MAGLRFYENPLISSMPQAVRDGQGLTLLEAGFIDVTKAPYNADPTGVTNAVSAFQDAIDFAYPNCFAIWVPKGVYRLSSGIRAKQEANFHPTNPGTGPGSNRKFAVQIYGDTTGGSPPILRADDGALGTSVLVDFQFDPENDGPYRLYCMVFRGFEIDMGNNPNATAHRMAGAQWCSTEDLTIYGTAFNVGVEQLPGSGGSTTNLTVTGGNYGILQNEYRPTPSVHGLRLINQATAGIRLETVRNALCIIGFEIRGAPTGILVTARGAGQPQRNLVLNDGVIDTTGKCFDCVGSNIEARNIYVRSGTSTIMTNFDPTQTISASGWQKITELATADDGQGFNSDIIINGASTSPDGYVNTMAPASAPDAAALIADHTWDKAIYPTWFNSEVLDVRDFGAQADDNTFDNSTAINNALIASAAQRIPAFLPRGFWYVQAPVECPVGAQLIGSSFTNCVINSSTLWQPSAYTAIFRTADAVGNVLLTDFCVNGHEAAVSQGLTAHKFITLFHGRSSNMLLRCVQINRREWFTTGHFDASAVIFSGNAGGRVYNLALDLFHNDVSSMAASHRMFICSGTSRPLILYQPDTEGTGNAPQVEIKNSSNVTWFALKFEEDGPDLLHINGSQNISVLGGSGNYGPGDYHMFRVATSSNVVVAIQGRQGLAGLTGFLSDDDVVKIGDFNLLTMWRDGTVVPFGEDPARPGFPPGDPIIVWSNNTYDTNLIIINATGGTFLGTSGSQDETYGFALTWNTELNRWELYYLTKNPDTFHVYHIHATNLASLSAANDSDFFSQSSGAGGLEWRIGSLVNRRNGNYDLYFNRVNTSGQFDLAYRPITSFPNAGALATLYDFDSLDGTTKRGYCGITAAPEIGKWVLAYWLAAQNSNDRAEGVRFKTATISYASAANGSPVDDDGSAGDWPNPDPPPGGSVFNISQAPYNAQPSPSIATSAIQAAIDDARAVGGVVTQNNPPVWNPTTKQMEGGTVYRIGQIDCDDPGSSTYKLWRLNLEQATTSSNFTRMLRVGLSPDWISGNTGRLLIQECRLDGRQTAMSGGTWTGGFSLEHNHAIFCDQYARVDVRHTTIKRTCGDGISMSHDCNVTARYVHCESCFRGGVVSNVGRVDCVLEDIVLVDGDYGCGTDIELFTDFTGNMVLRRITGESDFDIAAVSAPPSHNSVTGPTILVEDSEFTKQRVNFVGDFNTGSVTIRGTKFRIGAHQGTGNSEGRIHRPRNMLFDDCDIYLTDQPFKFHPSSAPPNDNTVGSTEDLGLAINMFSESVHTLEFRGCRFHVESVGGGNTLLGLFVQNGVSGSKIRLTQGCTFNGAFPVVNYGGCTLEHDGTTSPAGHWTGTGPVVLI